MGSTADAVKGSAATLYYIFIDNTLNSGAATYVRLWNTAAGSVTVGTTVPDMVLYVPGGDTLTYIPYQNASPGMSFSTALSAAAVTTGGTAGNSAPSSNVPVTIVYV
jgi:hypothetical protein